MTPMKVLILSLKTCIFTYFHSVGRTSLSEDEKVIAKISLYFKFSKQKNQNSSWREIYEDYHEDSHCSDGRQPVKL